VTLVSQSSGSVATAIDGAGNAIAVFGSSYSWHLAGGGWQPAAALPAGSAGRQRRRPGHRTGKHHHLTLKPFVPPRRAAAAHPSQPPGPDLTRNPGTAGPGWLEIHRGDIGVFGHSAGKWGWPE
jgi:hypothetical protein